MSYVPIEDLLDVDEKCEFFRAVKLAVIRELIRKGCLTGKNNKLGDYVFNCSDLQERMKFGIERFVYNQQGFCFTAIKAPINEVAESLNVQNEVLLYEAKVRPVKLRKNGSLCIEPNRRDYFLVRTSYCGWTILVQSVHWLQAFDVFFSIMFAASLSEKLKTQSVSVWDDDFSGTTLVYCDKGKKMEVLSTEIEETGKFYGFFYEQKISLNECFVMSDGKKAQFGIGNPKELERVDHVVLAVPNDFLTAESPMACKFGMMTEAMAGEIDDEADSIEKLVDSLWKQAQKRLKS